jgi:hypothetical protein
MSRSLARAVSFLAAVSRGRSSDGRNWCRRCGGVNVCYPWCGK